MKTFEYKNYLLCKNLFNCNNCKYYQPFLLVSSKKRTISVCKFDAFKDYSKYIRLTDFKVCSHFIPRYFLSRFNFDL